MKCFVINLKRAVERRNYISNQLAQVSQEFEFFEGVDWRNLNRSLPIKTGKNLKIRKSFRPMSRGELGCNLSHRKILNWLVKSSENMIAVLEDDVRVSKDLTEVLCSLECSIPTKNNFGIVFLGSKISSSRRRSKTDLVDLIPLNTKYNLSLSRRLEGGTYGYVITKEAAVEFLRKLPLPTGPIDDALHAYFLHRIKTYTLNPQVVFHEEEAKRFSYIKEEGIQIVRLQNKIMSFFPKCYEKISHEIHFRKRVRTEKKGNHS